MKKKPQKSAKQEKLLSEQQSGTKTSKTPKPKRKSRKEREKEGRNIGPILLVITIIISYLIILLA